MRGVLTALLALATLTRGGDPICASDVEQLDTRSLRLEKRRDSLGGAGAQADDPKHDAALISAATDAASFQVECEAVLARRFSGRGTCVHDTDCGDLGAGACAAGRCACTAGRAGLACEIDVAAVCATNNFWTAMGGSAQVCAGVMTRTVCTPGHDTCAGGATCATTERTCACPLGSCWDVGAEACAPRSIEVNARAWARAPPGELADEELMHRTSDFGIALSGGGTRAMVSAFGVLRGLEFAGLLSKARYLAANSGGSWAASIFTYASTRISDEALLGAYVAPDALTAADLYTLDARAGAAAARAPFGALLLTMANNQRLRLRDMWALCVAKSFFEPYGFGKLYSFLGYTPKAVAHLKSGSPELAGAHFDTVRPRRPYLLLSTTMLGPRAQTVGEGIKWKEQTYENVVVSPLYVAPVRALAAEHGGGAPSGGGGGATAAAARLGNANVSFPCARKAEGCAGADKDDRLDVAVGGAWETHAFGAVAFSAGLTAADGTGTVADAANFRVRLSPTPFGIAAAAGISSAAVAAAVSAQPYGLPGKYCRLAYLAPAFAYASPLPARPAATVMSWADGAVLDNFGIMGLLARGVGSVLLVASAEHALDPATEPAAPKPSNLDPSFLSLFGAGPAKANYELFIYAQAQVFARAGLQPLLEQLLAAQAAGTPLLATGEVRIVGTRSNGLASLDGKAIRLAVLYLGRIKQWEKAAALSAAPELPALIEQGNAPKCDSDCGPLRRFPHYFTVRENEEVNPAIAFDISTDYSLVSDKWTNMTDLTTVQVTALAHLQAYAAATSAERIAVFLGLAEPKELGGRQRSGASERDRSRAHAAAPPCCGQCVLDARCGLEQHARRLGAEQWGCYEELVDRTQPPVVVMACVDASGQPAACLPGAGVPVRTLHYSQHSLEHDLQRIHGCDSRGLRAESRSAATPTRSALRGGSIAAAGCAALVVVAAAGLATHARRRSGGVESEVELRSMRAA